MYDDGLVQQALEVRGLKTARVSWSDVHFPWEQTRYALFRSTWDYFFRFAEFRKWLTTVGSQTRLINDLGLIEWNLDKHYLEDLAQKRVNVVPTYYTDSEHFTPLDAIVEERGWGDIVIKPTISGTAMDTHKITYDELHRYHSLFAQLCQKHVMMVQPLQRFIMEVGEYSLVVIGGQYTHAVKKVAKSGDFRVQSDFGGTVHPHEPSSEEVAFAEQVVRSCSPIPHYARVDIIRDNDGKLSLVELELIEPELWFRRNPPAAEVLAQVIIDRL